MTRLGRSIVLGVVALAAAMVGPQESSARPATTRTVSGVVKNAQDRPVANATVRVYDEVGATDQLMATATTNSNGAFTATYAVRDWDAAPAGRTTRAARDTPAPDIYVVASRSLPSTHREVLVGTTGVHRNVESNLAVFVAPQALSDYLASLDAVDRKVDALQAAWQTLKSGPTSGSGWSTNLAAIRAAAQQARNAKRAYPGRDAGVQAIDAGLVQSLQSFVQATNSMTPELVASTNRFETGAAKVYTRGIRSNVKWWPLPNGCTPSNTSADGCDCVEHNNGHFQNCQPFLDAWAA